MITESDSMYSEEFKNYYVIHPSFRKYNNKNKKTFSYNSLRNNKFLKVAEINELIEKNLNELNND